MRLVGVVLCPVLVAASLLAGMVAQTRAAGVTTHYVFVDDGTSPIDYIDTFALKANGSSYSLNYVNSTPTPGQFSTGAGPTIATVVATAAHPVCVFHTDSNSRTLESFSFTGSLALVSQATIGASSLQAVDPYLFAMTGSGMVALHIGAGCQVGTPSSSPSGYSYGRIAVPTSSRLVALASSTLDAWGITHTSTGGTKFKLLNRSVLHVSAPNGMASTVSQGNILVFVGSGNSKQLEGDVMNVTTGALTAMPGSPATIANAPPLSPFVPQSSGWVTAVAGGGYSNYMEDFSYNNGQLVTGHFMEMDQSANYPDAEASVGDILLVGSDVGGAISMCDIGPLGGLDYCVPGATVAHSGGYIMGMGID